MALFEAEVKVDCSSETVFDFLIRPANIESISPSAMPIKFLNAPEIFEQGSRLEFELGGFGPPQRVTHEITEFERPTGFTETLTAGPLPRFVHQHEIRPDDSGGTVVIDRIEFEPPGGLIGTLITEQRLMDSFKKAFQQRHESLKSRLEQSEA